jgi:hypothetical protein
MRSACVSLRTLKHIEERLNLKTYADYRPVGSEPHPTMSGMGIWSYSYKA